MAFNMQTMREWRAAVDSVGFAVIIAEPDGTVSFMNEKGYALTGCGRSQGHTGLVWAKIIERMSVDPLALFLSQDKKAPAEYEVRITDENNPQDVLASVVRMADTDSHLITLMDISQRKRAERLLFAANQDMRNALRAAQDTELSLKATIAEYKRREEANYHFNLRDALTGLHNRAYFEEELRRLESGRFDPVGLIICDVDGLKLVNDTLGHAVGDGVLMAAARVIKSGFRESDVVARVGGDEFAVVLPNSAVPVVELSCQRIRDAVDQYNQENPDLPLAISVGFAVRSDGNRRMDDLFREADNHMYRKKLHSSRSARSAIVQTLMRALEARDYITEGHADRLQGIVAAIGMVLGLPERRISDLRLLAQFHDIGKVGIPDRILFKPARLTNDEFDEMRRHSDIGHKIAQAAPDLVPIADWILKHHEWWNGTGYPIGLSGEQIPLECRILAIADAYDAMTSDRPYRKSLSHEEAVTEIGRCAGTQFDPELVDSFIRVVGSIRK